MSRKWPKPLAVLVKAASDAIPNANSSAQSRFEALRQGEMASTGTAINGDLDVGSRDADDGALQMQASVFVTRPEGPFPPARSPQ
jgi:hypothetical protein